MIEALKSEALLNESVGRGEFGLASGQNSDGRYERLDGGAAVPTGTPARARAWTAT